MKALDTISSVFGFFTMALAFVAFGILAGFATIQMVLKPLFNTNPGTLAILLAMLAISLLVFGKLLWMFIKKLAIVGAVIGGILLIFKSSKKK